MRVYFLKTEIARSYEAFVTEYIFRVVIQNATV